jgi:hypothetical protein
VPLLLRTGDEGDEVLQNIQVFTGFFLGLHTLVNYRRMHNGIWLHGACGDRTLNLFLYYGFVIMWNNDHWIYLLPMICKYIVE